MASRAGGQTPFTPGHSIAPPERAEDDLEWADLRSIGGRIRKHPVLLLALVLIAAQVAWKAQFLHHLYFRQDDFHDLDLAVEHPFNWSYLTYIGSGHLIIGLRAIAWVLVRTSSTYNWELASAVSLAFVLAADLAALRLLRDLFGERRTILIPLGIYLLTPLTMPDLGIWSSALESVPLQLAIFMALSAHLRYVKSGGALHLAAAGFWLAFGLAFFEKALVLPVLLFAVTAAYFAGRSLIRGAGLALLRHWRAWVVYAVLTAGYGVVLAMALRTSATKPGLPVSATTALSFSWELIRDVTVPGSVGGPWHWLPVQGGSFAFAYPPHVLVPVAGAVAAAVVVVSIWRRRSAARAWVIFAGWIALADIVPVVIGRLNPSNASILGLETRYVADAMPVLAICLGLAFLPLAEQRTGRVTQVRHGAWSGQVALTTAAVLVGLYVFGSVWSVQSYLSVTTGRTSATYISNAEKALRLVPRGTTVLNMGVPGDMVEGLFHTYALQSKVIGDIAPGKLHWTQHPSGTIDGLRIFGSDGRLYIARVKGASSWPLQAGQKCWRVRNRRTIVRLERASPSYTGILRIGYVWFSSAPGTVVVRYQGGIETLAVQPGLHTGYVPISASISRFMVDTIGGGGLCIGDAQAGNLAPSKLGQILPSPAR
jgi:hypothetical protein